MAELSLADLVRNGTMDEHVAATLWTIAEERRSFMVTAVPRFAGKSTVSNAMPVEATAAAPCPVVSIVPPVPTTRPLIMITRPATTP